MRKSSLKKIRSPKGFRSNAEKLFAKYLRKQGIQYEYEPTKFEYEVNESRKYTPDFLVGKDIYIEFKGKFDGAARKKMLLVKNQNPRVDFRIVFMQDNKISKKSKTRYSDWAIRHGFKYHIGISLPPEWIKELSE